MRASEIMTKDVKTVAPTLPADVAWELMRRDGIRHLIVVNQAEVVGVLSERDAGGRRGAAVRERSTVGDLMTGSVVTAAPDDTVRRIANQMRGRTIGCVPVLAKKRLVGIVTTSDLLDLLGRGVDRPVQGQRATLSHRAPHRKRHRAYGVW